MEKGKVDAIIKNGTKEELFELRRWLFKESCRIENVSCSLVEREKKVAEEEKRIAEEKNQIQRDLERIKANNAFFEKKMDILKGGFDQLEADKKAFEKKKGNSFDSYGYSGAELFFTGINSSLALKKRYKDLLKIYHPDNMCGDTRMIQMINEGYSVLCSRFVVQLKA